MTQGRKKARRKQEKATATLATQDEPQAREVGVKEPEVREEQPGASQEMPTTTSQGSSEPKMQGGTKDGQNDKMLDVFFKFI